MNTRTIVLSKPKSPPVVLSAMFALIALLLCLKPVCAQTRVPHIVVDTTSLNFGGVVVNQSAIKTLTVRNTGTADLFVLYRQSPANPPFSVDPQVGFLVPPNGQQIVTVSFHPTVIGQSHDGLSIAHNDNDPHVAPTIVIALQGNSVVPSYTLSCIVSFQDPLEFTVGNCEGSVHDPSQTRGFARFRVDPFDATINDVVWSVSGCGVKFSVCPASVSANHPITVRATVKHFLPNGSHIDTDVSAQASWENGQ